MATALPSSSAASSSNSNDSPPSKVSVLLTKYKSLVIVLPYSVGLIWASLHATSSILTGDFTRPRGWYIDENSLETGNLRSDYRYHATAANAAVNVCPEIPSNASLCEFVALQQQERQDNVECHRHANGVFDLVKVVPVANTLEPTHEAIVLVVDHPDAARVLDDVDDKSNRKSKTWMTSQLHVSLLDLIGRLGSSEAVPWLSKTILLVSATSPQHSIDQATDAFLESYMGSYQQQHQQSSSTQVVESLPIRISDAMIRNLLVLDTQHSAGLEKDEIRILAQGQNGVLPNMDLVTSTMSIFRRAPLSATKRRTPDTAKTPVLIMHPYGQKALQAEIQQYVPEPLREWATKLGNLVFFCHHLLLGPHAPHALALHRGIDAVTIQGRHATANDADATSFVANFVQKVEVTLHALSNLHERLHHSTPLYLLPSPTTFVKHEEYLVPNLLLLIPIVLRAAFLGLQDITRFDVRTIPWMIVLVAVATMVMDVLAEVVAQDQTTRNTMLCLVYAVAGGVLYDKVIRNQHQHHNTAEDSLRSAQLILCLLTIYLHVPICFNNVSLSYPSAAVWAPMVAFVQWPYLYQSTIGTLMVALWIMVAWPPTLGILGDESIYLRYLYLPLHLGLSLSFLMGILLRKSKQ